MGMEFWLQEFLISELDESQLSDLPLGGKNMAGWVPEQVWTLRTCDELSLPGKEPRYIGRAARRPVNALRSC
jgi:hypothetical protein